MKDTGGYLVIGIGLTMAVGWIVYGINIFYNPDAFDYPWGRGELGDFLGGGISGVSVLFIIYTVWLQIKQIGSQQNETFEAGVFRVFQTLKPELEGLSVRIISKAIKANPQLEKQEQFSDMLDKYHGKDRTVFLRAMQKSEYIQTIQSNHNDVALIDAVDRFASIMKLINNSLNRTKENADDDFAEAIKATEIYKAYEKCLRQIN